MIPNFCRVVYVVPWPNQWSGHLQLRWVYVWVIRIDYPNIHKNEITHSLSPKEIYLSISYLLYEFVRQILSCWSDRRAFLIETKRLIWNCQELLSNVSGELSNSPWVTKIYQFNIQFLWLGHHKSSWSRKCCKHRTTRKKTPQIG